MTMQTKRAVLLLALLILGAAIVASQKTIQIPLSPKTRIVDRARTLAITDMPNPQTTSLSTLPILADRMPAFVGITHWWNTPHLRQTSRGPEYLPLTPEDLKGKVVLIDFWTYSCINCIRTYPFIKSMHAKYADKGLVIVGVHTPEFAFEAKPENVEAEIKKNGFTHPIALDPDYATWNAYENQFWPAEYFFDRQGRLRHTHFGEGAYEESENVIRELLKEAPDIELAPQGTAARAPDFSKIETRETYFGLDRGNAFMDTSGREGQETSLRLSELLRPNQWTANGVWTFEREYIESRSPEAIFRMSVQATKMHLVLESADGSDKLIEVLVDGAHLGDLRVNRSTLYDIASFSDAGRHVVELRVKDAGVRFYAATFS